MNRQNYPSSASSVGVWTRFVTLLGYRQSIFSRITALLSLMLVLAALSTRLQADTTGMCGGASVTIPFTDVPNTNIFFCSIAAAYFSGLTNGTSATTYSPSTPVPREQMAAFVSRTLDQSLRRGSRRAALRQWWTPISSPIFSLAFNPAVTSNRMRADTGTCSGALVTIPFTDVPAGNTFFCSIAEAYFSGLTNGTTLTTYSPSTDVTREQMAAFVTRTMDQSVKRASKRSALNQFWTSQGGSNLALTVVGSGPRLLQSDGENLWVANDSGHTVSEVHASNGKVLGEWTGATNAFGVLVAMGKVFVTGRTNPGNLYQIDPTQPPGPVITLSNTLGAFPLQMAFDGQRIWTVNQGPPGSVSITTLNPPDLTVTTVTTGFMSPFGITYDGANIWVTDAGDSTLKMLDSNGSILSSASVGSGPLYPIFDGINIWVPNHNSNTVSVVRAKGGLAGTVLATLTSNGMNGPQQAAFDGERILVTNNDGNSVSLWKASDLTPIGNFSTGTGSFGAFGACSDGLNFWITLFSTGKLARF